MKVPDKLVLRVNISTNKVTQFISRLLTPKCTPNTSEIVKPPKFTKQ